MSATIYIEGGGDSNQDLERLFRRSWTTFFKAAELSGHLPRIVRGGGRERTFDLFAKAIKHPHPKRVPLLLVDSEAPIKTGHSVWQHLQVRDGWDQMPEADDDQAFLMVQIMETWFLADRDSLKRYFGAEFRRTRSSNGQSWKTYLRRQSSAYSNAPPPIALHPMPKARSHSSCWRKLIPVSSKSPVRTPSRF